MVDKNTEAPNNSSPTLEIKSSQFDISREQLKFDEAYRYIKTSGAQFGLGGIAPVDGAARVVIHLVNTQFRPSAEDASVLTTAERRAVASIEMSLKGAEGLHDLLGRFLRDQRNSDDGEL